MNAFEEIDRKLAEWQSLQPLKPEDEKRLWKKLRLEWNYHSNHIEGNTLTYGETELLLIHNQVSGNHDLRDYEEMKAHDVAIEHLRSLVKEERPISEADIRDLNRILLKEPFRKGAITSDGQPAQIEIRPGEYKTQPNNVRTADGDIFEFSTPADVPAKMAELVQWYRRASEEGKIHPIEIASKVHHDFVLIHPFGDGNGRTARLLVNYIMMRYGYVPLIVPTELKDSYLAALRKADAGDMRELTAFLKTCATIALDRGLRAARGESIEDDDDVFKEIELFKQRHGGESESIETKSANALQAVFDHTLNPLFTEFLEEHKRFDSLFREVRIDVNGVQISGGSSWRERFARELERSDMDHFESFGITYTLRGFKGNAEAPFGVSGGLYMEFDTFQYQIKAMNPAIKSKPRAFRQLIPRSERRDIIRECVNDVFSQIKALSGEE